MQSPFPSTVNADRPAADAAKLGRGINILPSLRGLAVLALLAVTLLPFAAPLFMHWGWERPASLLYTLYGLTCHQLPQRSWFLFGPRLTYTLAEIQNVLPATTVTELRRFVGTPEMGWKVAWSDRMISWYTATALWGAVWWILRRAGVRLRPLRWSLFLLALAPLVADGSTHLLNDIMAGTSGTGFRDTNTWLRLLTANAWPAFYAGDAYGSFNWWARLVTGLLAALATALASFPRLDALLDTGPANSAEERSHAT